MAVDEDEERILEPDGVEDEPTKYDGAFDEDEEVRKAVNVVVVAMFSCSSKNLSI